jgi:hypothetical protein
VPRGDIILLVNPRRSSFEGHRRCGRRADRVELSVANKRLSSTPPDEQRQIPELLDVRVTLVESGSRKAPARVRLECKIFENASLPAIVGDVDDHG